MSDIDENELDDISLGKPQEENKESEVEDKTVQPKPNQTAETKSENETVVSPAAKESIQEEPEQPELDADAIIHDFSLSNPTFSIGEATDITQNGTTKSFPRKLRHFYSKQEELVKNFEEDRSKGAILMRARKAGAIAFPGDTESTIAANQKRAKLLAQLTFGLNVMLLLAKAIASALSGSLSIISSLVDSSVDITSGLVIWLTSYAIKQRDRYKYPRGRTRLEPLALVIVSVVMAVASFQVIVSSIQRIIGGDVEIDVSAVTIALMALTIVTKLALLFVCYKYRHSSPTIEVLAMDHRNDCVSNSVAIACAFLGDRVWGYLDPAGAILVSIYIAGTWFHTGYEQSLVLSGRVAESSLYSRVIKIAMEHDKRIQFVDTVHAYHFGTKFMVELDVVVDAEMSVREAHDLTEPLQQKVECLDDVERCFLHIDHEYDHRPDYEHKNV